MKLAAALSVALAAALPAAAHAETIIKKVPFTIEKPGVYQVAKDLKFGLGMGTAIEIAASGVTLDLGGRALICTSAAGDSTSAIGIACANVTDVTVRNGTVRGFLKGIDLNCGVTSGRTRVEDLDVAGSGRTGIDVSGHVVEVLRCTVRDTGFVTSGVSSNIWGIVATGLSTLIRDNTVVNLVGSGGQTLRGIQASGFTASVVDGNRVANPANAPGNQAIIVFNGTANFARDNVVAHYAIGLQFANGAPGKYRDNLTAGCATPFSGGTAIGTNS